MRFLPDIPYGPLPHQLLDLAMPTAATAMVVYLHGGGFVKGSRKEETCARLAAHLGPSGTAVASVSYRLNGTMRELDRADRAAVRQMAAASQAAGLRLNPRLYGPAFAHALHDIGRAVAALRSGEVDAALAGLPVVLLGMSAGGIAALSLAYPPHIWAGRLARPDAVLAVSAAMVQPWLLHANGPACVMVHSAKDRIIPTDDVRLAETAAKVSGAPVGVRITDVVGHVQQLDWLLRGTLPDGTPGLTLLTDLVLAVSPTGGGKGRSDRRLPLDGRGPLT